MSILTISRRLSFTPVLVLGAWLLSACAGADVAGTNGSSSAAAAGPTVQKGQGKSDDFLVVDCLLPGQVRRLGAQATFLTPRRPIKTSARDCEIRGGEYVSYDRSNYATALQVWLPRAQQGEALAQTYVGEIFEKGLGLPPDHGAAAEWYQKAAASGFSRAAINLGHLYEQGLGVPKDPRQALNWYRRAAGLGDLVVDASSSAEMQGLRQEVGDLRRQLQGKQAELDRAQADLDRSRRTLAERSGDVDRERQAIAQLRRELDESRAREQTASARLRDLNVSVTEREGRVSARDREVADLRAALARAEGEGTAKRAELDRLIRQIQAESGAKRAELEQNQRASEAEVGRAQQELDRMRRALEQRTNEAAAERTALTRLRQDLEESRGREHTAATRLREVEQSIQQRETSLTAKERETAELRASLARSEKDSATLRAELERLRKENTAAAVTTTEGPEIKLIEPELVATRGTRAARAPAASDRMVLVGRVDSPAGLLSLTVNGREERLDGGSLFKTSIPAPKAEDRVQIVAIDKAGRRSTLDFVILARPDAPGGGGLIATTEKVGMPKPRDASFGNYHALVIGNNDYTQLKKLRTAVNDAREVARILETQYGVKVTLLLNANRYQMLSALNALRERLTEKDNLIIYYAGHGEIDQKNQRGNWLPVDAEPGSTANWISNIQITDILNAMSVQQLLVVADSCYAGTMTRSGALLLEGALSDEARVKVMQAMAQKRSRMVLSSGGVEPVLDSTGGRHSAFAQIFIELLESNGGVLAGQDMFRLLQLRVAAIAQRLETQQVPEYAPIKFAGHESGDFFFVRAGGS